MGMFKSSMKKILVPLPWGPYYLPAFFSSCCSKLVYKVMASVKKLKLIYWAEYCSGLAITMSFKIPLAS